MRYCAKCGAPNGDNTDLFCATCGNLLPEMYAGTQGDDEMEKQTNLINGGTTQTDLFETDLFGNAPEQQMYHSFAPQRDLFEEDFSAAEPGNLFDSMPENNDDFQAENGYAQAEVLPAPENYAAGNADLNYGRFEEEVSFDETPPNPANNWNADIDLF